MYVVAGVSGHTGKVVAETLLADVVGEVSHVGRGLHAGGFHDLDETVGLLPRSASWFGGDGHLFRVAVFHEFLCRFS